MSKQSAVCPLCDIHLPCLTEPHLRHAHGLTLAEFRHLYPGTVVRMGPHKPSTTPVLRRERKTSQAFSGLTPRPLVDLHKGGTIVLIGNAPSLRQLPLGLLQEYKIVSIGCNRILRLMEPTYCVVADREAYLHEKDRIRVFPGVRLLSTTIFDPTARCRAIPVQPEPDFRWTQWRVTTASMLDARRDQKAVLAGEESVIQLDPTKPLVSGANIAFPMVQWAMIMGATRIGLIGIDFSTGYFFGDGKAEGCAPAPPKALLFHQAAAAWIKKHHLDVTIRNLSPVRGPMDDIYGKEDFMTFLGGA